jgi:hypothetical protein
LDALRNARSATPARKTTFPAATNARPAERTEVVNAGTRVDTTIDANPTITSDTDHPVAATTTNRSAFRERVGIVALPKRSQRLIRLSVYQN